MNQDPRKGNLAKPSTESNSVDNLKPQLLQDTIKPKPIVPNITQILPNLTETTGRLNPTWKHSVRLSSR